jgi:hypothetical protein
MYAHRRCFASAVLTPAALPACVARPADPHGLALTPAPINRMVTLDYVEYASTFKPSAKVK